MAVENFASDLYVISWDACKVCSCFVACGVTSVLDHHHSSADKGLLHTMGYRKNTSL